MKRIAIIGASYLQEPLIRTAMEMGIETHVFVWKTGDVGESLADFFYPISIVEKDEILKKCEEIGIDGVCSIASDLASITVNYVASKMGLVGNSMESSFISTNKHAMREVFWKHGDPSPKSFQVESETELDGMQIKYPVIVKPVDRSGSRGITKLETPERLKEAIENAKQQGFQKVALVEEFAEGEEFSVECISWKGKHYFLAMTKKYTTGAPGFIETAHMQPALIERHELERVKAIVFHALDSLKIENGASHTELKLTKEGQISLIEIGGRMGGDCIGSDLVRLSTGFNFVRAVIQIALGEEPEIFCQTARSAAIRYIFGEDDIDVLRRLEQEHPEYLVRKSVNEHRDGAITDSSSRFGYFLVSAESFDELRDYMPV